MHNLDFYGSSWLKGESAWRLYALCTVEPQVVESQVVELQVVELCTSCRITSCRITSCRIASCRITSCRIASCRTPKRRRILKKCELEQPNPLLCLRYILDYFSTRTLVDAKNKLKCFTQHLQQNNKTILRMYTKYVCHICTKVVYLFTQYR
jgi:hypothetical protein